MDVLTHTFTVRFTNSKEHRGLSCNSFRILGRS